MAKLVYYVYVFIYYYVMSHSLKKLIIFPLFCSLQLNTTNNVKLLCYAVKAGIKINFILLKQCKFQI